MRPIMIFTTVAATLALTSACSKDRPSGPDAVAADAAPGIQGSRTQMPFRVPSDDEFRQGKGFATQFAQGLTPSDTFYLYRHSLSYRQNNWAGYDFLMEDGSICRTRPFVAYDRVQCTEPDPALARQARSHE